MMTSRAKINELKVNHTFSAYDTMSMASRDLKFVEALDSWLKKEIATAHFAAPIFWRKRKTTVDHKYRPTKYCIIQKGIYDKLRIRNASEVVQIETTFSNIASTWDVKSWTRFDCSLSTIWWDFWRSASSSSHSMTLRRRSRLCIRKMSTGNVDYWWVSKPDCIINIGRSMLCK